MNINLMKFLLLSASALFLLNESAKAMNDDDGTSHSNTARQAEDDATRPRSPLIKFERDSNGKIRHWVQEADGTRTHFSIDLPYVASSFCMGPKEEAKMGKNECEALDADLVKMGLDPATMSLEEKAEHCVDPDVARRVLDRVQKNQNNEPSSNAEPAAATAAYTSVPEPT